MLSSALLFIFLTWLDQCLTLTFTVSYHKRRTGLLFFYNLIINLISMYSFLNYELSFVQRCPVQSVFHLFFSIKHQMQLFFTPFIFKHSDTIIDLILSLSSQFIFYLYYKPFAFVVNKKSDWLTKKWPKWKWNLKKVNIFTNFFKVGKKWCLLLMSMKCDISGHFSILILSYILFFLILSFWAIVHKTV